MKLQEQIKEILEKGSLGHGITPKEAMVLMDPEMTGLAELIEVAEGLTRRLSGDKISMCAIYPAKVGRCSGDCAFCAQSAYHHCDVVPVRVSEIDEEELIANAGELWRLGVRRYSLVTSGEYLTDEEFDLISPIFTHLREKTEIGLCASLGRLTPERAERLVRAGVSRYHHNIETGPSFFPQICSTHRFEEKLETIRIARRAGMEICSGGIIALGESPQQRVEMAFALKELAVDSVPINILNPIPGTRLENQPPLAPEEILRTIAVFRLILPQQCLRYAGGREKALGNEEYTGYRAGINGVLAGNYLTTKGKRPEEEGGRLAAAGFMAGLL